MAQVDDVGFFVFDVESVADGDLIARVKYPGETLSPQQAIRRYRDELLEESDGARDFIPYTYQIPIAIVIAKVSRAYELLEVVSLDEPQHRPYVMIEQLFRGWDVYQNPTWVSFNGRAFDMPLLELAAYRYGCSLGNWFAPRTKSFDQPRNRFNTRSHLDLLDVLTNNGASRFSGGLNLAAELIGKPGKMATSGFMVQDMFDEGKLEEISDYCRCDVLDTYFVFLRCSVLRGEITLQQELDLTESARRLLEQLKEQNPIYGLYLQNWRKWENPGVS